MDTEAMLKAILKAIKETKSIYRISAKPNPTLDHDINMSTCRGR